MLTDTWTDDDGYKYSFALGTPNVTVSKDVASARPGEVKITGTYTFAGELSNQTSGHDAPVPRIFVEPIWSADSAACKYGGSDNVSAADFSSNTPGVEGKWCTAAPADFPGDFPTEFLPTDASGVGSGTATVPAETGTHEATLTHQVTLAVPEGQADAVMAALQSPAAYAVGRKTSQNEPQNCLMLSGGFYVTKATVDTQCTSSH